MTMSSHLEELRRKHRSLSEKVEEELRRPGFDDLQVAELKRRKLRLKEEIKRLSQG